ncbi:hypothetical protein [Acuticoccus sediminis]|nr:hypothetical protein [Acuticoccus sediminis]
MIAVIALLAVVVPASRRIFVWVALALTAVQIAVHDDWMAQTVHGLSVAAFVAAFFSALTTLRHAAQTSPAIAACGRFLANQPPGRRYAALSVGGQLFSLLLNYGAIALLGSLAASSAREEKDPEIRAVRMRRMLLAIQRALVATLPWSPLSFAVAISTSLLPGTSWSTLVLPSFVSGLLLVGIGYALDTIFKPRVTRAAPRPPSEEGWGALRPLVLLLVTLFSLVATLQILTGVRTVGVVASVVPFVSAGWVAAQAKRGNRIRYLRERALNYMRRDLLAYRGEITLLSMAAYIGTVGSTLVAEWLASIGTDLSQVPAGVILVALVWVFTFAGQVAMNPILTASMILPLLPTAAAMGVSPTSIQVAVTAGWALSGANSPFTATTLITGSFAGTSPWTVGLRWNGLYSILCGTALSVWVLVYAFALS